jgi:hypothetical protein
MNKTRELQTLWWDWLGTSERLLRSLSEQRTALVQRDLTTVERLQPELDAMMERMKSIDDLAAASASKLAEDLGAHPSLRGLTDVLPEAEAQMVRTLANRVRAAATTLSERLDTNRKLISNELTYVNGSLALIAKAAHDERNRYGNVATPAVLIDQAA